MVLIEKNLLAISVGPDYFRNRFNIANVSLFGSLPNPHSR